MASLSDVMSLEAVRHTKTDFARMWATGGRKGHQRGENQYNVFAIDGEGK